MLLIITNRTDLASDYLILRLKARGLPFMRLNTEEFGTGYSVDLMLGKSKIDFLIEFSDGKKLRSNDINSVYIRQPSPPSLKEFVADTDLEFAEREAIELLRSLWRMIPEEKWLNHPRNLWCAANKVEQLLMAINIGLETPTTLISAKNSSVTSFINDAKGSVIAKAVKHGFLLRENEMWVATTQRLPSNYTIGFSSFAQIPMMYQNEINKEYDIRVVVVSDNVFATAIHSQVSEETSVDWRVADIKQINLRHEIIPLPELIKQKCIRLVRSFSLKYSSMDFALGRDGVYYFLELNPNGQWAWIEQLAGHPIRDAIIDTLMNYDENESR